MLFVAYQSRGNRSIMHSVAGLDTIEQFHNNRVYTNVVASFVGFYLLSGLWSLLYGRENSVVTAILVWALGVTLLVLLLIRKHRVWVLASLVLLFVGAGFHATNRLDEPFGVLQIYVVLSLMVRMGYFNRRRRLKSAGIAVLIAATFMIPLLQVRPVVHVHGANPFATLNVVTFFVAFIYQGWWLHRYPLTVVRAAAASSAAIASGAMQSRRTSGPARSRVAANLHSETIEQHLAAIDDMAAVDLPAVQAEEYRLRTSAVRAIIARLVRKHFGSSLGATAVGKRARRR